jgi:hypothetical protein
MLLSMARDAPEATANDASRAERRAGGATSTASAEPHAATRTATPTGAPERRRRGVNEGRGRHGNPAHFFP